MDETHNADTIIRPRGGHVEDASRGGTVSTVEGAGSAQGRSAQGGSAQTGNAQRGDLEADTVVRGSQTSPTPTPTPNPTPTSAPAGSAVLDRPPAAQGGSHRVSINGGEPLHLDVPLFVGRNPRLPRVRAGAVPRLCTVPSPRGEVSATHLELSQVGTSVVLSDLRSTNGTVVSIPGARPITMRAGESIVAVPGTIVEIGDGNRIEILLPPRLRASDLTTMEPAQ